MKTKEKTKAYDKTRYEANKEKMKADMKAYYQTHKEEKKAYQQVHEEERKAYRQDNKEGKQTYDKIYNQANKEERNASSRAYYEANKEEVKVYTKSYREANKKEIKAKDRVRHKANPENRRAAKGRRRAKEASTISLPIRPDILNHLIEVWDNKCAYCKKPSDKYHLDHFMPFDLKGHNTEYNLALACPSCNLHKSAKHPFAFIKEQKICFTFKPYMKYPY